MQTGISQMLKGLILLWYGAIADIPEGWALCDGSNGTPDLVGKFIGGAGNAYNVGVIGGAESHTHAGTTDGHQHNLFGQAPLIPDGGSAYGIYVTDENDTFTTNQVSSLPPFHILAYIMKL